MVGKESGGNANKLYSVVGRRQGRRAEWGGGKEDEPNGAEARKTSRMGRRQGRRAEWGGGKEYEPNGAEARKTSRSPRAHFGSALLPRASLVEQASGWLITSPQVVSADGDADIGYDEVFSRWRTTLRLRHLASFKQRDKSSSMSSMHSSVLCAAAGALVVLVARAAA
jgi:hypothetical protein